ncbi:TrmB family transcriptional regulator [Micromonospora sp. DR5-3]|uniref:helix-turn-helix domain-containing protein n=1 Tax=unclassified Micromonospora TaxID=2617518 RepID=UPI0011D7A263|nr:MULTISPECIES: helix-turn-helix domain-containing protein [unclassified Micromonospora]MCW3819544.1 TrmB family transcriptional regulator [Micromonospora sp. DR5-3]TYC20544.1 TrmB family transcriptional regulator [Micromonospora sp. MP36]
MLDVIGLNPGEEELYRALVQLTTARVDELVERLRRPRAEVVAQLDALRGKGLVLPTGPEPDAPLRPLAPDVPLGEALLRRQEALEAARAAVTQLTEEYRAGMRRHDADHLVEVITGARVLRERLRDAQNGARVEVLWFCRANPLAMPGQDNVEEFDALARGVRYRAIYEREMLLEPGGLEDVERGVHAGEQARVLDRLPVRLAIVDARTAICPLVPERESGEPSAAVIGRSQLLDALLALFESYWRIATPLRSGAPPADAPAVDGYRPDADEVRLLSLFVAGVPDKSIASQLGVSRRTVQRRLADLMTVAGVDTRPGLAYQAARRGWL